MDFDVPTQQHDSRVMWIRSFWRCRWVELRASLSSAPWHLMSLFDDIDDQWNFFYHTLQQCLDEFIPLKRVRSRKSRRPTPWFTDDIQKKSKIKTMLNVFLNVQAIWMIDLYLESLRIT